MTLTISGISKSYPNGVRALNRVSLEISSGLFGLVGPNGAGKSSLMRTLATLQEADEGTAFLDDLDVLRDKDAVRRRLGYLPQEFGVYPKMTALAMLDHVAALKGIAGRGERRDTVDALLRQTNLYDVRKKRLGTFSGGMKQRFGIAIALIGRPDLVIVDEPTAGLDPTERHRFLNLLSALGEQAVVILSTHIIDDVRELCAKMAIIDRGEVVVQGSPQASIDALAGRIWKKTIDAGELAAYRARHRVVSDQLLAGRTEIRVHSDGRPDASFAPVEADLRDVYFMTLAERP